MAIRQQHLTMDNLLHQVLRLHNCLNKLSKPPSAMDCEGGRHKSRKRNHPMPSPHTEPPVLSSYVKRPDNSFRRCKKYNPVADGGLGNHQWTQRQKQAANRIMMQIQMATVPIDQLLKSNSLKLALIAPSRFRNSLPKAATFPLIWDSSASDSISPDRNGFVEPIKDPGTITKLSGIAKGLLIEGFGHVMWAMHDSDGQLRMIKVPAYLATKIRVRACSLPQASFKPILMKASLLSPIS